MDDEEIKEKAYSKTYFYPEGFEYQTNPDGSIYYENSVSIGTSQTEWIELHTNFKDVAKSWSEISAKNSSYYRELTEERETEKYFEFKRVYIERPTDVLLSRVHKSSYYIPKFDKFRQSGILGTFTQRPVTAESVKTLIEHIWSSGVITMPEKVLQTNVIKVGNQFQYNMKSAQVSYGDWDICDRIYVNNVDFFVDEKSGEVTYQTKKIKEIEIQCKWTFWIAETAL